MMHRREFLRRAGLIAAGVVAADQLDILEMLAPRSLFAGWAAPAPLHYTTISELAALYKKTDTNMLAAIKLQTVEAEWFRSYPYVQADAGRENRIVLATRFTSNLGGGSLQS